VQVIGRQPDRASDGAPVRCERHRRPWCLQAVVRRVHEAIYVGVLAPPEEILPPSNDGMRPATLELFERLFGRNVGEADC